MNGIKDITVSWGNSFHKYLNFFTDSTKSTGKNITGWTIYFTVKENIDDTDTEAKISYSNTTHLNPSEGQSEVYIPKETMKLLSVKEYYYDIKVKTSTGEVFDIIPTSKFRVNSSTTLRSAE